MTLYVGGGQRAAPPSADDAVAARLRRATAAECRAAVMGREGERLHWRDRRSARPDNRATWEKWSGWHRAMSTCLGLQ